MEKSRQMSSGLSVSLHTGLPGDCVLFNIILIPSGWGVGSLGAWAVVVGAAAYFTWWATRIIWVISGALSGRATPRQAPLHSARLRQQATPFVSNTQTHTVSEQIAVPVFKVGCLRTPRQLVDRARAELSSSRYIQKRRRLVRPRPTVSTHMTYTAQITYTGAKNTYLYFTCYSQ